MSDVSTWNAVDDANTAAPPHGWPEFMMPSGVNNCGRMMMGAVRRMYDQQISGAIVLPYLNLSGGTVTGPVSVAGLLTANSILSNSTISAASNITTSGHLSVSGHVTAGGTVTGGAIASSGTIHADGDISTNAHITAAGHITAGGTVTGGAIASSGTIHADGDISTTSHLSVGGHVTASGNITAGGTIQGLDLIATRNISATGTVFAGGVNVAGAIAAGGAISAGSVSTGNISVTGGVGIDGPLTVGGNANLQTVSATAITADVFQLPGGNQKLHLDASFQYHTYVSAFYWAFDRVNGTLYWAGSNSPNWVMRNIDGITYNPKGPVQGNGDYVNISDRRTKDAATITPATQGLAEILQLQPVEFQRLPVEDGPPPIWELGFVAQDVATVLPQAVSIAGVELPDGTGGLSDTEPTLGITSGAIVAALVNCVKQIDQRLTAGGL